MHTSDEVSKLGIAQPAIAIGVDASNDLGELVLGEVSALRGEEVSEIVIVDHTIVVAVDSSESCTNRVVVLELHVALHILQACLEAELALDDIGERSFDVGVKVVKAADDSVGETLLGVGAKVVVLARENHLIEVALAEATVVVGVEETDKLVALALKDAVVAQITQVVDKVSWVELAAAVAVDSLVGSRRHEVSD
jgi:hypothetical protein